MANLSKKQKQILQSVMRHPFTEEENQRFDRINHHSEDLPHWSNEVKDWPRDRWDPMTNAPKCGMEIRIRYTEVKSLQSLRNADLQKRRVMPSQRSVEYAHYACGGGDEQPAFNGWFERKEGVSGFTEIPSNEKLMEWQPLWADKNPTYAEREEQAIQLSEQAKRLLLEV